MFIGLGFPITRPFDYGDTSYLLQGTDRVTTMGLTNQFAYSAVDSYIFSRTRADFRTGRYEVKNPRFIYANWGVNPGSAGETGPGNSVTIKAGYEISGVTTPILFGGSATVTLADKEQITSDILPITIPPNTVFESRLGVQVPDTASGYWDGLSGDAASFTVNGIGSSDDKIHNTGSMTGGAGILSYGASPIGIVGELPEGAKSVGIFGDSIAAGVGDTSSFKHIDTAPNSPLWTATGSGVSLSAAGAAFVSAATGEKISIVNSTYFRSPQNYNIIITISSFSSGEIQLYVDGSLKGTYSAANGTHTINIASSGFSASTVLELVANGTTTLNITNVTITALYPFTFKESGMYTRALVRADGGGTIPHGNFSRPGEFLANLAGSGGDLRKAMGKYYTHVVIALGTNDFGGTPALSTMQGFLLNVWAAFKAQGCKVAAVTIMPRTTSWYDQTPFSASYNVGGVKDQLNSWIRTQIAAGKIDYVIDLAAVYEDPGDSSKWKTSGQILSEGTHPNACGVEEAKAELDSYITWVLT